MLSIQRSFKENKILNNPISVPAHYYKELDELNSIDILTKNHYHHHTNKQLHSWTTELLALNPCGTKVCAIPNDRLEVNNMPRSWVWLVTRIVNLIVDLVTNSVISQNDFALTDIHFLFHYMDLAKCDFVLIESVEICTWINTSSWAQLRLMAFGPAHYRGQFWRSLETITPWTC